jgi:group II intron reverse transcriptase/maturase
MLETVHALQQTLSDAAKLSLDRRFGALYDKVYRADVLWQAWRLVRNNDGGPGIDGETFEYIENELGVSRFLLELRDELKAGTYRSQPVKRCWIDKPGKKEKRPLGVPIVRDRVVQTAVRLVIEPIFETNFLDCSYGFRPGRRAQDAISEIQRSITFRGFREVLDADLKSYFDSIPQGTLMKLVQRRISDRRVLGLIKAWLKCGVMEDGELRKQVTGTPQGGCISPLLSNIYLHSFDKMWQQAGVQGTKLIRYADDFVILCRRGGHWALQRVRQFLARLGLVLNEEKTRVVSVSKGFDFLGMTFRYQKTSRQAKKLQYCCYRWPRQKAVASLQETIRRRIGNRYSLSLQEVVHEINPILRGWYNYFKASNGEPIFRGLDRFILNRLRIFVKRKHNDPSNGSRRLAGDLLERLGLFRLSRTRISFGG